jgi:hypothetical protein
MIIMLEEDARTKVCPRLAADCHGSGCMAWKAEPADQEKIHVDWPADIERPRIDFTNPLNSGLSHKELAGQLYDAATAALQPCVGGTYAGGKRISRAVPSDPQLKQVTLTLEGSARGGCVEMGARS